MALTEFRILLGRRKSAPERTARAVCAGLLRRAGVSALERLDAPSDLP
jgi:hypothetical protein